MVILHHFSQRTGFVPPFIYAGTLVVACFFLMSGYGLMTSYLKKQEAYLEHFLFHRFKTLFIPYFVMLPLCVVPWVLIKHYSIWEYFTKRDAEQYVPNTWFVWVLAGGYLAFRIIFGCKISMKTKLLLFALVSLSYYVISKLHGAPGYWYLSSSGLFLGMVWRYKEETIMKFIDKHIFLFPVLAIIISIIPKLFFNRGGAVFPVSACMLFIWFAYIYKEKWANNKLTIFLSSISYELYLSHGLIIDKISHLFDSNIVNFTLLIIATIVLSTCVNKVSNFIKKMIW